MKKADVPCPIPDKDIALWLQALASGKNLEPERTLAITWKKEGKSKQLVDSHLWLVVAKALPFTRGISKAEDAYDREGNIEFSFKQRIADGYQGLQVAIQKWDPDKGFKFGTYATWWIQQAIHKGKKDTK